MGPWPDLMALGFGSFHGWPMSVCFGFAFEPKTAGFYA